MQDGGEQALLVFRQQQLSQYFLPLSFFSFRFSFDVRSKENGSGQITPDFAFSTRTQEENPLC